MRSEEMLKNTKFVEGLSWLTRTLTLHLELTLTVRACVETKPRKGGGKLYRGERALLTVALKDTIGALCVVSPFDRAAWANLEDHKRASGEVLCWAVSLLPSYRLPEREIPLVGFNAWVIQKHKDAGERLSSLTSIGGKIMCAGSSRLDLAHAP